MRRWLSWILGGVVATYLLAPPQSSTAQNYMESKRAEAEKGDAAAQYTLGLGYEHGYLGVPKDISQAVLWLTKSADQGNAEASFDLAKLYLSGSGVEKNEPLGLEWLRKTHDYGPASLLWSDLYTSGTAVPQDQSEALRWLRLAAEQGSAEAQFRLAQRYRTGQGVQQDMSQAIDWYSKAAKGNSQQAANVLGKMYESGDNVPQDLDKAAEFFKMGGQSGADNLHALNVRFAERGDVAAQVNLGKYYETLTHYYKDTEGMIVNSRAIVTP